jgi:hypothetical protein
VYRLPGKDDLGTDRMPPAGQPILHTLGYPMHAGGHGAVPSDRDVYLEFMKMDLRPYRVYRGGCSRRTREARSKKIAAPSRKGEL